MCAALGLAAVALSTTTTAAMADQLTRGGAVVTNPPVSSKGVTAPSAVTNPPISAAAASGGEIVTVLLDVDVYDEPVPRHEEERVKPKGVLRAGNKVTLLEARKDGWCRVQGNAVPSGGGWVFDGPTYNSLR